MSRSRVLGLALGLALLAALGGRRPAPSSRSSGSTTWSSPRAWTRASSPGCPSTGSSPTSSRGWPPTTRRTSRPSPGWRGAGRSAKDGLVYTFNLRDATWTDGRKVTAHDFVYAWERVLNPKSGAKYAQQLYYLKNGEDYNKGKVTDFAPGRRRRRWTTGRSMVTLRCPTPYFLDLTTFYTLYPVPRWTIEAHGKDWVKPGKIVSNGPFRLASWVPQRELVLEKNPAHWDAATVKLSRAVFIPTDDLNTAYKQFQAGDSDWIPTVPPAQIDAAKQRPEYYVSPYLGTYYFRFNVTKPPFTDARVRKALSMAVDREALTRFVTKAGEIPTTSFVPASMRGYEGVRGLASTRRRRRSSWPRPGFPDGKGFPKVELLYNTSELHRVVTQAIQQMWKEHLGIEVDLANVEWKVYLARQSSLDYQISRGGLDRRLPGPQHLPRHVDLAAAATTRPGWSSKRYDELIARAETAGTPDRERMKLLAEAEKILVVDEAPILPLYTYVNKGMLSRKVKGWQPNILDQHPLKFISIER